MKVASGSQIFLRYAFWPRIEEKMKLGKIDQCTYEILRMLIKEADVPPILLLEKCFPGAVEKYRQFCVGKGCEANFSRESVTDYWHNYHKGPTSMKSAVVCMVDNDKGVLVVIDEKTEIVLNPYKLSLKKGELVFTHNSAIVEKAE